VRLVPNEQEEALARARLRSFEVFGGIPLVTVWDNPKTLVQTRRGDLSTVERRVRPGRAWLPFAPEQYWPRAGTAESRRGEVGWVKRTFFACRRFHDRVDLERQLAAWLTDVNTLGRAARWARSRPSASRRSAGGCGRYRSRRAPTRLNSKSSCRLRHGGAEYSMLADTLGHRATLHLYEECVEIATKAGVVVRHRRRARGTGILPEHRAALLGRVPGTRGHYLSGPACHRLNPGSTRSCSGCGGPLPGDAMPVDGETPRRVAAEILVANPALAGERIGRSQRMLLVVSRDQVSLYSQLVREFADKDNIRIIMDRRVGDRRVRPVAPAVNRRGPDRRVRAHTDSQLRALGWSVIRFDGD
jgi:hypothetical protein